METRRFHGFGSRPASSSLTAILYFLCDFPEVIAVDHEGDDVLERMPIGTNGFEKNLPVVPLGCPVSEDTYVDDRFQKGFNAG